MKGLACIIGAPERKKTDKGAEVIFEEIMTEVFSRLTTSSHKCKERLGT